MNFHGIDTDTELPIENNPDLAMPDGLDAKGQKAHEIIVAYLKQHGITYTGG